MAEECIKNNGSIARSPDCLDILDSAGIGILAIGDDGRPMFVSRAVADMYGFASPEEMMAEMTDMPTQAFVDPSEREEFMRLLRSREHLATRTFRQVRRDGTLFWVSLAIKCILRDDGRVNQYHGVIRDITDQHRTEEKLRAGEDRFRRIAEGLTDYLYTVRIVDGYPVETTHGPACVIVTGYTAEEFASDRYLWIKMVVPEDREKVRDQAKKALAGYTPPSLEHRIVRKDGRIRWVKNTMVLNFDARGRIQSYDGLIRDISERKEMETALRESESRVRSKLFALMSPEGDLAALELEDILDVPILQRLMDDFFNLTKIGSAVVDLRGKVLVSTGWQDICTRFHRVNSETRKHCLESDTILSGGGDPGTFKLYKCRNHMWDMATPIVVGDRHLGNLFLGQFFFNDEEPDMELFLAQARRYGFDEQAYVEALNRAPRFSRETVHRAMTFYTRLANLVSSLSFGHVKLARAMVDQARAEEEIRKVNARLEQALAEKDKFFSIIAHDLRSPFIGFLALVRLMSGKITGISSEDMQKLVGDIKGNAENVFSLLENLLEWARMQRGFTAFDPQPYSLDELVHGPLELVRPSAEQKDISLYCDIPKDIIVSVDKAMINTVIRNFLFNAVKFTGRAGKIEVSVLHQGSKVEVSIQDTGVGMDDKTMASLFSLDQKCSRRGTEGERGTGLGLVLCKEFVEKHGGNILVKSVPGQGSTFSFTLPLVEEGTCSPISA